ncbi:MAG: DNA polymerase I [Roseburia sp.]|nr:DNA polymerase I [Roseburia sp.]
MSEKLVLIDGHSILNRAFFGIPDLTNSEGLHTNAVYGFLNIMFKILEEEQPNYLTVAFDVSQPTFRHEMYAEYKGTRKPMAAELREQVPVMKEMLKAMGVTVIEKGGYEADDLLGTIAKRSEAAGLTVSVVSGDRDLLQLASEKIKIRIPKTKRTGTEIEDYNTKEVQEKYLVTPTQFIDVKALMGDTSDNIPGVPGIGEKTATNIIAQYGSIENAYAHVDEIKPPRASNNLKEHYDMAQMSKTLATIETNADIDYKLEDAKLHQVSDLYTEEAYLLCKRLEFKNMLSKFEVEAPKNLAEDHFKKVTDKKEAEKIFAKIKGKECAFYVVPFEERHEECQENEKYPAAGETSADNAYMEADGQMSLFGAMEIAEDAGQQVSGNFATPAANSGRCACKAFMGLAIAFGEADIYYVEANDELSCEHIRTMFINSQASGYTTLDLKPQLAYLGMQEKKVLGSLSRENLFDNVIAAYLLNPIKNEYPYEDIAKDYANQMIPSRRDLLDKMTYERAAAEKPEEFLKCVCYTAYVALTSKAALLADLKETEMEELFRTIEMPLVFTLADMEKEGIIASAGALKEYGDKLAVRITELEKKIYEEAGEEFNINSPKQLGVILFEKLQMPNGKKTKTGYSTAADVLEHLAPDYPIVADILEYRQLTKLKSTYADGLAVYIGSDGRIHTSFNQTITATGRLSSTEPNLQNIPMRIELGRLIRKAFLPKEGFLFVDADYSQIELRVLAHLSGDEMLIDAYKQAQDIHRITASQVFHIPFDEVTDLQRRNAKAVNFGIVYGISSFGLSQDLSISRKEAADYIERYFETYPKIKTYLDGLVTQAKEKGYVTTMYGRRRPVPELSSSNYMQRSFGERIAMNSPIQGTAADIIKIAMIRVHDRLLEEGLKSRLILTVHDELLVETAIEEESEVTKILQEEMRGVADLSVMLEIDVHSGHDWYEAK